MPVEYKEIKQTVPIYSCDVCFEIKFLHELQILRAYDAELYFCAKCVPRVKASLSLIRNPPVEDTKPGKK